MVAGGARIKLRAADSRRFSKPGRPLQTPTILHLSDQHLAEGFVDTSVEDGHAVADAIFDLEQPGPALVCDTGDVTASGLAEEYELARSVVDRYRDRGFGYFICPANHDMGPGGGIRARYAVDNFHEFAAATMPEHDREQPYPHLYRREDLAIVVTDSCAEQTMWSRGILGDDQRRRLTRMVRRLNARELKICMMIHHCPTVDDPLCRLVDRERMTVALNEVGGVDVMLTGHLHRAEVHHEAYGATFVFSSPSTTVAGQYRRIWWEDGRLKWAWTGLDGSRWGRDEGERFFGMG